MIVNNLELRLLENVLDSLDRLFDCDSQAVDVYALLFATAEALLETSHYQLLDETTKKLDALLKAAETKNELREAALIETNKLRHYIAKLLPPFVNS